MQEFLKYTLATLCGLVLFLMLTFVLSLCSLVSMAIMSDTETKVEKHSVYRLDLDGVLYEQVDDDPYSAIFAEATGRKKETHYGLDEILANIREAKENKHIEGIYLRGGAMSAGFASMQEIRRALLDFKQSGKFVVAYADDYGQGNYWLATVADRICLNPTGSVNWSGLSSSVMFYTRALEKLGVEMQVLKVGTFKSAVEPYMLTEMSEANRLQMNTLLDDIWTVVAADVAEGRNLTVAQLNEAADLNMQFRPQQWLIERGLVDTLVFNQSMDTILTGFIGTDDYHILTHSDMLGIPDNSKSHKDKIAILYAEGEITDDSGDGIVGTKMVRLINKLAKDDDVKAVVMRVNSPGGSADASEQIHHALSLLREKKPLVVSMGDYAASGGYYISCQADSIFAEPATLTGSIGIFGLIPNFSGLADKVGIDIDGIGTNRLSQMESNLTMKGMNPEEKEIMQAYIRRGYELFTLRCAEGRGVSQDSIKQIAEGRVWSGTRALQIGLVDRLGNTDDALKAAAALADLDKYETVIWPEPESSVDQIVKKILGEDDDELLLLREYARIRRLAGHPSIQARIPYDIKIK